MLTEHERAILTTDIPEHHLKAGDLGIVVHVYEDGKAYEVEFFTANGQTYDVVMVAAGQVRAAQPQELLHVRSM
jgi:hypothetical protein